MSEINVKDRYEVGAMVGKYGVRHILRFSEGSKYGFSVAEVPLPRTGMNSTIETRRAERDAIANQIVRALNGEIEDEKNRGGW